MGKVLVTGGLGFIGSHTVVELLDAGQEVVIVDNLSNSRMEVLDRIEKITGVHPAFEKVDLVDYELIKNVFEKFQIESVIHFAASKAVGESVDQPLKYYRNNLQSLINLLELCRDKNVNSFVFSSSCTVYGQPEKLPVSEKTPVLPATSPYGNTKQIGEEIIKDFCRINSNLKAISLRYFNPIGAHETALIGELPIGVPANLVPFITQTAAGIREKLSVFGGDYQTKDGTCVRDYIHVVDLAQAHIKALEFSQKINGNYDVFNVGTGAGFTVLEVIASFERVSGLKLNYEIVGRRPGDIEQIYATTDKATELIGWKAQKSLDDMLESAWKWQQTI